MKAETVNTSGNESTPMFRACCSVSGIQVLPSRKARIISRVKYVRDPTLRKNPRVERETCRKKMIPARCGMGKVAVRRSAGSASCGNRGGVTRAWTSRASRARSCEQDGPRDPEDDVGHPGRDVRRENAAAADRLGELDEHEEDDRRRQ